MHVLHHKLEAIGFGLLIPVFFIVSGMKLDVIAIFDNSSLFLAGLVFIFVLVTRIPVVIAHHGILPSRQWSALSLYSATTLSLVVALAEIGMENGLMKSSEAAPLVGGAMLTVIVFPMIAMRLTGGRAAYTTATACDGYPHSLPRKESKIRGILAPGPGV